MPKQFPDRPVQSPYRLEQSPDRLEQSPDRLEQSPDRPEQSPDRPEQPVWFVLPFRHLAVGSAMVNCFLIRLVWSVVGMVIPF